MRIRQHHILSSGLFSSIILLLFIFSSNTINSQTTETFTSSTTWIAPAGVTSVEVECWGAGGGGAYGSLRNLGNGGAGGGAYSKSISITVIPGNNYTVNVGALGLGGNKSLGASEGGDTWFINSTIILAKGGLGGGSATGGVPGTGSSGGLSADGIGDLKYSGGTGGNGDNLGDSNGGGGGSSAGTAANGGDGGTPTAGVAPSGGGNGGLGGTNSIGLPGAAPGGGGGGSGEKNDGGNGANGQIKLSYTASAIPTITLGANPSVVEGSTTANLTYSATTNSPDQYSINYDATAEGQGFVDVTLAALTASPIVLTVPGASNLGTYDGILTVKNSGTGEVSGNYAISVTITPGTPTITITDANPSVVQGITSANIPYSATTFNPDQYSINYDSTAEGQGFVDVTLAALTASPIVLTVPGASNPGTYDGTLTVKNSGTGEVSGNYAISVTITPGTPTITITDANPSVVQGITSANILYSATTFSPDQYSINYDSTAEGQGFVDVTLAALTASPIVLTVPGAAAVDTYNGTLTVKNSGTGEVSGNYAISVILTPGTPTITITDPNPSVVQGITTANVPYSATTFSPDQYSINYDATAEGQGFVDVTLAALTASPIVLTVPGAATVDTYNGTLTVRNSGTGEISGNYAITVTITAAASPPTITLGANPSVIEESTSANLTYSATTNSPDQYSIDFDVTAEGQGFVDVTLAALTASPIVLTVPGAAAPATYNGTLTVKNSGTGLTSGNYPITVTITPGTPTITITDPNPSVVQGITTANVPYSATTFNPDQYSINYDATAEGEGFVDVSLSALTASPIVLTVPGAAAVATYNGTLTVRNSGTGEVSGNYAITVTITAAPSPPTITLGANPSVVEESTSANLTYSATTESPDQYSINYDATAEGQGFVDVTLAALTASPIVLTVPGAAGPATYNGTLTVKNSGTGLTSGNYPITVTITPGTPTITITDANPSVVQGITTANVPYSATTFSPDQYSINYDATAEGQGFVDVSLASLPASPIVLTVPGAAAVDTYNGTLTVRNSGTGEVSGNYVITVTITAAASPPTITLGANPSVVEESTSANLTYSATTESPDQYSINYDATAEGQGFVDVTLAALTASPIVLTVPGAAAPATYNGTLTVKNSGSGLTSGNYPISVTITPGTPTITITDPNPSVVQGITTANVPYSATTFSPDEYSIDYDATAEGQGFVDVSLAALTASPIVLTVPGAAAVATYNGILTVKNSGTGAVSGNYAITVTITTAANPPTITLGTITSICSGTTSVNLPYTATTESPDQYSIDFDATANSAGFVDILNNVLPVSPISITVPGAAPKAVYNAILTVRNSSTGLLSGNYGITITINDVANPIITGDTTVPANSLGFKYTVTAVPDATIYNWTVPSGWSITAGDNTNQITVKTGAFEDDGNITLTITNDCGAGNQASFPVTVALTTDHTYYNCTSCHITHNAPGSNLTNVAGNALLCQSCHISTGAASAKPLINGDNGVSSHKWDVLAVNATLETNTPTDSQMAMRIVDNKIICSTCHNQHNTSVGTPHLRISNTGDALCKDCHSARNVGIYSDAPLTNKGSHPVGITYDTGDSRFNASPTNTQLVGGKVECSSCHGVHDVTGSLGLAANGNLLRTTNDANLCKDCHNFGDHNGMDCLDCHDVHNPVKDNIYMIKDNILTPNSGSRAVVFTALTGPNSFADNDEDNNSTWDGVCEVCHTTSASSNHHNFEVADTSDSNHYSGQNCTSCHPHSSNFTPSGGNCTECHQTEFPNWGISDAHFEHTSKYSYSCSTCHLNYGSGGSLEPSHPDGGGAAAEVNIDLNGMATRGGQDANSPVFNGDKTCDNIYCHSNGRTAHRGEEADFSTNPWDPDTNPTGSFEWGVLGPQTATYITTPAWDSGTITVCNTCHGAAGNMEPDYTIINTPDGPVTGTGDVPPFDSHTRGAHISNSQNLSGDGWSNVQCFWCHNTNGSDASPNLQGTYGTSLHVDGESYFRPLWYSNGGTMVNTITYSAEGSAGHCGDGKTCW